MSGSQEKESDRRSWLSVSTRRLRRRRGSARIQRLRRALRDRLKLRLRPKGELESKSE